MSELQSLPNGWISAPLGVSGAWHGGGTPSKFNSKFWSDGTVPWVSPKDMKTLRITDSEDHISELALRETSIKPFPAGTVLIVIRSGILSRTLPVAVSRVIGTMNQDLKGIVPLDGIEPDFVAFYLQANEQDVLRKCSKHGTTVASIDTAALHAYPLRIAPLNEQRRIVAKIEELFSDLDAGVAALTRAKANLKRYRASVLKAAVEGHLTATWRAEHPDTEPASALLARILTERRQKWEADQLAKFAATGKLPPKNWKDKYPEPSPPDITKLPEVPDGWCWASVGQLLGEPTCNGISIKGSDSPPGVPALRLNSMTPNGFNYGERRYIPISNELAQELAVQKGDMFVSRGNGSLRLVGRSVLAQEPPDNIVFPDTMIRVRLIAVGALREFVNQTWSSHMMRRQIEKKARTTAGIYKISQRDVEEFVVPLPPLTEQKQVIEEVAERLSQIDAAAIEIEHSLIRAARLRQSILKQAFEGKLVPQDPTDEPVSELLRRIKSANEPGANVASVKASQRTRIAR